MVLEKPLLCTQYHASHTTSHTGGPSIPFDILLLKTPPCDSDVLPVVLVCNQRLFPRVVFLKKVILRTSLVAQWLRIRLPVQGTWVRALVWEDPTCCGATKPVLHNYWAHVPQRLKPTRQSPFSATREATAMRSPHTATKSSPRSPQLEKARGQQRRSNAAKNK